MHVIGALGCCNFHEQKVRSCDKMADRNYELILIDDDAALIADY